MKVVARLQESEKGVQWVYYPDKEKPEAVYAVLALSLPPSAGAGWLLVGEDVTDYWLFSVRFRNGLFLLAGMLVLLAGTVGHIFSRRAIVPIVEAYEKERAFLVDASHELRAPLSVVQASLEVLEEIKEKFPPFYQQVFSDMVDEVQRMQRLVQDLFWLARHERGLLSRQEVAVDLCDLALKVFRRYSHVAEKKEIQFVCNVHEKPVMIRGDREDLVRLCSNLLDNALKFTYPGGKVELEIGRRGDMAVIRVKDTGAGIPKEALPRIFDRFYRADPARSRAEGGAGIGLAIVKAIVENHGGTIAVESEEGQGTVFTVELPLWKADCTDGGVPTEN